ncbi:sensor histidine kinase [Planomonospora parontospora]|uniref:sensor histidine kinase n=1 Tax=Planomonospora parontospora TaxID=58119 RepID=UPI0016714F80|nr:sensor histidine kinase [Planomonospora parontospora]GGL30531.1 two-component sensor histidine kinase [Planomonospora parontospora subsp. antibiotica]GII16704.1 two-component sensor histidine kinase [Planomonospora parontospora subsp. antibiotica]
MSHRPPPTVVDWTVAVAVALFGIAEELGGRTLTPAGARPGWLIGAVLCAAGLVLVRRRAPFTVLAVHTATTVASLAHFGGMASAWQFYVQLLLLFTLLSELPPRDRRAVAGMAGTAVFVAVMVSVTGPPGAGDVAVALLMSVAAGGAGVAVRRHRRLAVRAQELAVQVEERGELLAREAVTEERVRIARELHDVVAHGVSVMVMQAGAARLMLDPGQVAQREALTVVEETGREAVEELRRMVGLLRTGPDGEGLAPQPGLARLDDLVEQVRAAGLEVDVSVEGVPAPLPTGLDLSAYRIVQEALANTLRHAGPTRSEVTVAYRPRMLCLDIVDEGPRDGRALAPAGTGHGLIGMRERVALFHGRLSAGPLPEGGYGVRVSLPLAGRMTVVS